MKGRATFGKNGKSAVIIVRGARGILQQMEFSGAVKGGKRGKLPPLSLWAVFPVCANPLRKFFRGYTSPTPPNFVGSFH